MFIVEVKLDFLCVSVDFREINRMPSLKTVLQLSVRNFVPPALNYMPNMNSHFRGRLVCVVTGIFEANTFEHKFFVEFNFNP